MERLTLRNGDGTVSQPVNLRWADALCRLAAYEDTGLTPEEIKDLVGRWKRAANLAGFFQEKDIGHLRELVALPCKAGDTVWLIACPANIYRADYGDWRLEIIECTVVSISIYQDVEALFLLDPHGETIPLPINAASFGKTFFLTREEAKAALSGGEKE